MSAIKRVIDKAQGKTKNHSGETIAETLVALLISSIALMMLASMINSTVNLVTKSEAKMGGYYTQNAILENSEASRDTFTISIKPGTVSDSKLDMSVKDVHYQINDTFSKTVVAYSYVSQGGSSAGGGGNNENPPQDGG